MAPGEPGAGLAVRGLTARAGAFELAPADLDVAPGRVLALLGPSGSGKTTLLHAIAGLIPARSGTIALAGRDLTALPPERRRLGVVFQRPALFPHLSVAGNVRFGPRARGRAAAAPGDLLQRLGIAHLAGRSPRSLSGGESQRVALARALAVNPAMLLLDEPLSALDLPAREDLRSVIQGVLAGLAIPVIYVTHDRDEALSLGDDVAILAGGAIRQAGPAEEVLARPAHPAAARLLGWRDLGSGTVRAGAITVGSLTLTVPEGTPDGPAEVFYRPEEVTVRAFDPGAHAPGPAATFAARVERIVPTAPLAQVHLAGPVRVTALLLRREMAGPPLRPGGQAWVTLGALRAVPSGGPGGAARGRPP